MERRIFLRMCAASAACAAAQPRAATGSMPHYYSRARLVDEQKQPLRAAALVAGRNYVFHYPFEATPCFLINLGKPSAQKVTLRTESGGTYEWPGGVGASRAIVAYSAICTHRMTYPTRQISFIGYRHATGSAAAKPYSIHCCSEHSEYDPAAGARVSGGPAPQPLSAILLEYEAATDGLYALGTLGGEMFDAFFAKYDFKLALDYGTGRARERVGSSSVVTELTKFCRQQVQC